ncbi:P-II family nitrogen regulator [Thermocrinis sp.]
MISQKKVEIVVNKPYLKKILEFLEEKGVKGYTVIEDALGLGERGLMRGDELTDTFKNSYIFTVCDEETAKVIAEGIVPYLKRFGGVCLISDVLYVKH